MMHQPLSSLALLRQEWRQLLNTPWLWSLLTWVPVVVFLLIWWIFSAGLVHEIPLAVVDNDHSPMSRSLARYYDASPTLQVSAYDDLSQAQTAMQTGQVFGVVVLPSQLEVDVRRGRSPQVQAYYNGQFLVLGRQVSSALLRSHATFNARLSLATHLSRGNTPLLQAFGQAVPLRSQMRALFNSASNYAQFIVSAALPAVWQILIMVVMVLALGSELRQASLREWLSEQALARVSCKLLVYGVLLWLQGVVMVLLLFQFFAWPLHGSWAVILSALGLCVLASQCIVLWLMVMAQDMPRVLSVAAALVAPSFAFMGVTFPTAEMPVFAQLWRKLIPICHYIEVQMAQANYLGVGDTSLRPLLGLCCFALCGVAAVAKITQFKRA